jgi:putative transposase
MHQSSCNSDKCRALNTLRYIHNPKAANMQQGFFYDFSNYGSYDRLTCDGISQWHPAFLALGTTLEICAAAYRKFCKNYRPLPKPNRKSHWGSKKLAGLKLRMTAKKKSPGQQSLWDDWNLPQEDVEAVAKPFVLANCLNPDIAILQFTDTT